MGGRVSGAGCICLSITFEGQLPRVVPSYLWAIGKWPACVAFIAMLQMVTLEIALVGWGSAVRPRLA